MRAKKVLFIVALFLLPVDGLNFKWVNDRIFKNLSDECGKQLWAVAVDAVGKEQWALKMLDASAKPQSGLLTGNLYQMGNYDECLGIDIWRHNSSIRGKYCTVHYDFVDFDYDQFKKLKWDGVKYWYSSWGICVPQVCSDHDFNALWSVTNRYLTSRLKLNFNEDFCDSTERYNITPLDICVFVFFGFMAVLLICSTGYDVIGRKTSILTAFSLYTNAKRLFSKKTSKESVRCLNGIRVISMMWVVLGHQFMISAMQANVNQADLNEWLIRTENMAIVGGTVSVDSFLFISGFLVFYLFLLYKSQGIEVKLSVFYLHRILRLSPALIATIAVYISVLKFLGTGPYWLIVRNTMERNCITNWWTSLLFLQNYFELSNQCIGQAWYISADTQLFFIAPIFLFTISRWPKRVIGTMAALALASSIAAFVTTWKYHLGAGGTELTAAYFKYVYLPTYMRAPSWIIGAIFGYVMLNRKENKIQVGKALNLTLWALSLAMMSLIVFGQISFTKYENNVLLSSLFNGFARPTWALCLGWIILACAHGYGESINRFLSSYIFNMLVRLNYSMFLLHLLVITIFTTYRGTPGYWANLLNLFNFWGDLAITFFASVLWTLAFESPITIIDKFLFEPEKQLINRGGQYRKNVEIIQLPEMSIIDLKPQ